MLIEIINPVGKSGDIVYEYGVVPAELIVTGLNDVIAVPCISVLVPTTADVTASKGGCETVMFINAGDDVPPELLAV